MADGLPHVPLFPSDSVAWGSSLLGVLLTPPYGLLLASPCLLRAVPALYSSCSSLARASCSFQAPPGRSVGILGLPAVVRTSNLSRSLLLLWFSTLPPRCELKLLLVFFGGISLASCSTRHPSLTWRALQFSPNSPFGYPGDQSSHL